MGILNIVWQFLIIVIVLFYFSYLLWYFFSTLFIFIYTGTIYINRPLPVALHALMYIDVGSF